MEKQTRDRNTLEQSRERDGTSFKSQGNLRARVEIPDDRGQSEMWTSMGDASVGKIPVQRNSPEKDKTDRFPDLYNWVEDLQCDERIQVYRKLIKGRRKKNPFNPESTEIQKRKEREACLSTTA